MKKLFFLLFVVLNSLSSNAQFKVIAAGPVFDEPENGFGKILHLKNGNTLFLHVTIKEGVNIKIYDAAHKQKVEKHLEPAYGKIKNGNIDGIFEINGDATLLISEIDEKKPVLYRLIIDGKTGHLKEEKKIAELNKLNLGQGYAMAFGGVSPPDFYVRKDAHSDHYAVAMMNSFEADRNKRIEIIFYGPDHKELSRAYYSSPEDKYKYLRYIDMTVIGKEKVSVLAYAYNTRSSGGKESELVLANLDEGSTSVTLQQLAFSKEMEAPDGITRYNPVTKKIILLATARMGKTNQHAAYIATIDPFTSKVDKISDVYPTHANEKSRELFGQKNGYDGMPQNLFINKDGSYSVIFEEITIQQNTFSSGSSVTITTLGNIAVLRFDASGKQTGSYLVPKRHKLINAWLPPFYHSDREGSAQLLKDGNQFKSFAYLNGGDKSYILFNDVHNNAESVLKGKLTTITGVGECDGFYFEISGLEVMPERKYVFGKPESKRDNNLGLFSISDYDPDNNLYVTLKLEKEGRDKGVRLLWMQP